MRTSRQLRTGVAVLATGLTTALTTALVACLGNGAARPPVPADAACVAAAGDAIPHPAACRTAIVRDGDRAVRVPVGTSYVPAGPFTMGDGGTAHRVDLDAFCIGTYLVTNAEYAEFLAANPSVRPPRYWHDRTFPSGRDPHPVVGVSWYDADRYCKWVARQTGWFVALPTEAQWEKAARGGTRGYRFPRGDDPDPAACNSAGTAAARTSPARTSPARTSPVGTSPVGTSPVGTFPRNRSAYGPYDLAGDAAQWCADWYARDYAARPDAGRNPIGPPEAEVDVAATPGSVVPAKVVRGGGWDAPLCRCTTTARDDPRDPRRGYDTVGFRIVAVVR